MTRGYPDGISVVLGIAGGKSEIQSVRFDRKKFTVAQARKWLEDHKMKTGVEAATAKEAPTLNMQFQVLKTGDEHQVYGWLYVCNNADGSQVVDHSGEIVKIDTLERAAVRYMLKSQAAGSLHMCNEDGSVFKAGRIISSIVFTSHMTKALGIPDGVLPQGWFVGYLIEHEPTWQAIKNGTLKCFSIGGRAKHRLLEAAPARIAA